MSALSEILVRCRDLDGFTDREIARRSEAAGEPITNDTVSKYMSGDHGRPSEKTLRAFSKVLNIPMAKLREAAGLPTYAEHWSPPEEADRLTPRQRRAVDEIIRAMVDPGGAVTEPVTAKGSFGSMQESATGRSRRSKGA